MNTTQTLSEFIVREALHGVLRYMAGGGGEQAMVECDFALGRVVVKWEEHDTGDLIEWSNFKDKYKQLKNASPEKSQKVLCQVLSKETLTPTSLAVLLSTISEDITVLVNNIPLCKWLTQSSGKTPLRLELSINRLKAQFITHTTRRALQEAVKRVKRECPSVGWKVLFKNCGASFRRVVATDYVVGSPYLVGPKKKLHRHVRMAKTLKLTPERSLCESPTLLENRRRPSDPVPPPEVYCSVNASVCSTSQFRDLVSPTVVPDDGNILKIDSPVREFTARTPPASTCKSDCSVAAVVSDLSFDGDILNITTLSDDISTSDINKLLPQMITCCSEDHFISLRRSQQLHPPRGLEIATSSQEQPNFGCVRKSREVSCLLERQKTPPLCISPRNKLTAVKCIMCDNRNDINKATGLCVECLAQKLLHLDEQLAVSLQKKFDAEAEDAAASVNRRQRNVQLDCSLCNRHLQSDSNNAIPGCDECGSYFCSDCFSQHCSSLIQSGMTTSQLRCPTSTCTSNIVPGDIKQFASNTDIDKLSHNDLSAINSNLLVECPNKDCSILMEIEGKQDRNTSEIASEVAKYMAQEQISKERAMHYIINRVRCRACDTVFCADCRAMPYHTGQTCDDVNNPLKCRFCSDTVPRNCSSIKMIPEGVKASDCSNVTEVKSEGLLSLFSKFLRRTPAKQPTAGATIIEYKKALICSDEDCQRRSSKCCKTVLKCGHPCYGFSGEKNHLPCLHEDCIATTTDSDLPCGDDFCTICWIEPLQRSPCVRLDCGHIFHLECLVEKIKAGWPTTRITFDFMNCPLCKKEISGDCYELRQALEPRKKLKRDLSKRLMERLRIEGLYDSKRLLDRRDVFYQKRLEFAVHVLCYYQCFKCERPYFGGLQQCNVEERANRVFKREELVCGSCADDTTCPLHGSEYIQFKCRYCCKPAVWFCWGTTHFCDNCHSVLPRPLPQCTGAEDCPLGISHPPNGQEYAVGCMQCLAEERNPRALVAP